MARLIIMPLGELCAWPFHNLELVISRIYFSLCGLRFDFFCACRMGLSSNQDLTPFPQDLSPMPDPTSLVFTALIKA
jgi:hypothetical protein